MDNYVGKRLEGRYEIQEMIGMGGMANVYKAYDIIDERTVAVKILRDEFLDNTEFLRRFKNESKAIAVLSHPNIVRVYDVSFSGRVHSIVMEYIDGITLKDYIERQKVVGWKEAVHFTLQILRALQHAHDKGIVHRDIKPQNIMLLQNGTIKVTDFGIARFARSEVKTITDRAIGSVHYISPEQAMGDNTDEKSDIYSVGVMLFEMLTGKLPFEAENAVSVAIKQIQSQAVRPTSLNPGIPDGLEDITVRAMQKGAARRYQSAAEMIADIESFKQNPSINFAYQYLDSENDSAKSKKYRRAITETREGEDMEKRKKRTPYLPILTGVTFAFVLASLGFIGLMVYLNNPFTKVEDVQLPNLVGIKYDTASVQYDNFELVQEETNFSNEYGKGVIYEQNPKAGKTVKTGSTIHVKVSSGQQRIVIANFTDKDAAMAFAKLKEQGLRYEEKRIYSDMIREGGVVYTDPSKDSEITSDTLVTVYVSMGPETVWASVPPLEGLKLADARRILENTNLRVGDITYEDSDKPADVVIAQDPESGSLQPIGTAINIMVSRGTGSDFLRLFIPVKMPQISRTSNISATQNGVAVQEETFAPADVNIWNPAFEGKSGESYNIKIYIDSVPYMEYTLNFTTKAYTIVEDYSADFNG